jgi:hypothetical protein
LPKFVSDTSIQNNLIVDTRPKLANNDDLIACNSRMEIVYLGAYTDSASAKTAGINPIIKVDSKGALTRTDIKNAPITEPLVGTLCQ